MNVLPFLFDHAGVTGGWKSGKDSIKDAVIQLQFRNHFLL